MIGDLIPLLIAGPLLAAGVSMAFWRLLRVQQVMGVGVVAATLAFSVLVLVEVAREGTQVVYLGGWEASRGITLVVDVFAALLLVVSLATVLAVLVFAIGQPRADKRAYYFHPLYLILTAGVAGSFMTGDLFNLFVAFEIMLSASYVLITLGGRYEQVRTGMTYVVINLLSSILLVTTVGLIYAATGTVNMAEVAVRMAEVPDGVRTALGVLLLVTFGVKAAIFPLFFWLPDSYPTAPSPVTAVFAGLLTKVGVYAIIRTQTLIFPTGDGPSTLLLWVAALTMVVGVLGAIAQDDMKRILSFHIVSQIGYMIFGLALYSVAGIAGAVIYILHQIPAKTSLFLASGLVETTMGSAQLRRIGGLLRRAPLIALLFLLPALSLAGIPPFAGFVAKLSLVQAGLSSGEWVVTGVSLAVSLLTLFSMTKIWAGVFWGEPEEEPPLRSARGDGPVQAPKLMNVATIGLVGFTIGMTLVAAPLWDLSFRAAEDLVDPAVYAEAVLEP